MNHRRNRRRRKDDSLVRDCVIYAQAIGALKAGYEADPDPNGRYAGSLSLRFYQRAEGALARIAERPTHTSQGLEAKARIVPVIVARHMGVLPEAELISHFADEVRADLAKRRPPPRRSMRHTHPSRYLYRGTVIFLLSSTISKP